MFKSDISNPNQTQFCPEQKCISFEVNPMPEITSSFTLSNPPSIMATPINSSFTASEAAVNKVDF